MAKAAKNPLVEISFPIGGLNRQSGFEQTPPYCTPYAFNVRPFDVVGLSEVPTVRGMRQRGGARPGLVKAYDEQVEAGPIQLLSYASKLGTSGVATSTLLAVSAGCLYQNDDGTIQKVTGYPHFNAEVSRLNGTQIGQKYYIADVRTVNLTGTNGTVVNSNRLSDATLTDDVLATIDTATDVVWVLGSLPIESNVFPISSVVPTGSGGPYLVFNGTVTSQTGGVTWQIGRVTKVFDPSTPTAAITGLMGVPTSGGIPSTHYNTGTVESQGVGWFVLTGGTWAGIPAAVVAKPLDYELMLTIPVGPVGTQRYQVASIDKSAGHIQLQDTTNNSTTSGAWVGYTLSWKSDYYGLPPLNCPLCCTYRGRLVLAGPGAIWYMSRVLNPNDWDYGFDPQDPSRAIAGTSTTTGGIPDPILALMPHSDDYLIFGCEHSLWMLTADPAYGGQISALSRDIGVLGQGAWCNLPDGSIVFLSRDGLYYLQPGSGAPQPISRDKLPAELINVDWVANTISMAYDVADRGIHLSITPASGEGTHYFLDWVTKSFWPVVFGNDDHQPNCMVRYATDSTDPTKVILGCQDGYLRKYSTDATDDDGTAIQSLVTYGPLNVGGTGYYGEILQIMANLDANGTGVAWGVFGGETAQEAIQASVTAGIASGAHWNGTWTAGDNHRHFPRAVGAALVIMVSGTYGWALEGMQIETRRRGQKK